MMAAILAGLFYLAAAVLVAGLAWRIRQYAGTPAPLKIPTTPAPTTTGGVVLRLVREVVFFESLFKASKWTWIFGWSFHAGLLLVLLGIFGKFGGFAAAIPGPVVGGRLKEAAMDSFRLIDKEGGVGGARMMARVVRLRLAAAMRPAQVARANC